MPTMYPQQFVGGSLLPTNQLPDTNPASSIPPLADPEARLAKKRKRYYEDDSSEDDEDAEVDPESYYQSTPQEMEKVVNDFIGKTFHRCLPKRKRFELAREYPKPSSSAVAVPTLDYDIKGALGKEVPEKSDAQMAKIQATVLATCAPLANFWSHLAEQQLTGKPEELIPVSEVIKLTQDTLALIGNASNYISQSRRSSIISSISKSRPKLSSFMKEICKDDIGDTGTELFGPEIRKKITERANTIDAFNKAITKVDNPPKSSSQPSTSSSFLSKGPTARYGGESGRSYTPYKKFRPHYTNFKSTRGNFRNQKRFPDPKRKD